MCYCVTVKPGFADVTMMYLFTVLYTAALFFNKDFFLDLKYLNFLKVWDNSRSLRKCPEQYLQIILKRIMSWDLEKSAFAS